MMDERWVPVLGFEDFYEVSDQGRLRSLTRVIFDSIGRKRTSKGRIISPGRNKSGHLHATLCGGGKREKKYIHHAVLDSFIGEAPDGCEALHYDDDPGNNSLKNLRWGTRSDNIKDAIRNGRNSSLKKTHCLRGHSLEAPNLKPSQLRRSGRRTCLACSRTHSQIYRTPDLKIRFQELSDRHYRKIMGEK